VPADPDHYLVKIIFTEVKDCAIANSIQISEIRFFDRDGNQISIDSSTAEQSPTNSLSRYEDEYIPSAFDGRTNTKWLDHSLDGCDPAAVEVRVWVLKSAWSYAFVTADDRPDRDPKSWSITVCDTNDQNCFPSVDVVEDNIPENHFSQYPSRWLVGIPPTSSPATSTSSFPSFSPSPVFPSISPSFTAPSLSPTFILIVQFHLVLINDCGNADAVELSQIRFFKGTEPIPAVESSWSYTSSSTRDVDPDHGLDNLFDDDSTTRWVDYHMGVCSQTLTIQVQVSTAVTHYTFVTGSGPTNRDPKSWTRSTCIRGSCNAKSEIGVQPPTERQKEYDVRWALYPDGVEYTKTPTNLPSLQPSPMPSIRPSMCPSQAPTEQGEVSAATSGGDGGDPIMDNIMFIGGGGALLLLCCLTFCFCFYCKSSKDEDKKSSKFEPPPRYSEVQMTPVPNGGGSISPSGSRQGLPKPTQGLPRPKRDPQRQGLPKGKPRRTRFNLGGNAKRLPDNIESPKEKVSKSAPPTSPKSLSPKASDSNMQEEFKLRLQSHATLDEFICEEIIKQIEDEAEQQDEFVGRGEADTSRRHRITSKADNVTDLFHAFDTNTTGVITLNNFKLGMKKFLEGPAAERIRNSDIPLDDQICEDVFRYIDTQGLGVVQLRQWLDFCNGTPTDSNVQFIQEIILAHSGIDPTAITTTPVARNTMTKKPTHGRARSQFDGVDLAELKDLRLYVQESFHATMDSDEEGSSLSSDHANGDTIMEISDDSSDEFDRQAIMATNRKLFMGGT